MTLKCHRSFSSIQIRFFNRRNFSLGFFPILFLVLRLRKNGSALIQYTLYHYFIYFFCPPSLTFLFNFSDGSKVSSSVVNSMWGTRFYRVVFAVHRPRRNNSSPVFAARLFSTFDVLRRFRPTSASHKFYIIIRITSTAGATPRPPRVYRGKGNRP